MFIYIKETISDRVFAVKQDDIKWISPAESNLRPCDRDKEEGFLFYVNIVYGKELKTLVSPTYKTMEEAQRAQFNFITALNAIEIHYAQAKFPSTTPFFTSFMQEVGNGNPPITVTFKRSDATTVLTVTL